MHHPRLVFAAPSSGSGKTTITCGVLQAFKNQKKKLVSFKCGPDFIDPMFQERVLGIRSGTLDLFFSDENTLRRLFVKNAEGAELSVIEGVMGFYDGLGPATDEASTYHIAKTLQAPVILIINARGQALSALAELEGFLRFRADSGIRGVIFNQMSEHVFRALEPEVRRMDILPIGFLPKVPDLTIESRHLGLVTPGEIENLSERLQKLASLIEQTFDLDLLLHLSNEAPELECPPLLERHFSTPTPLHQPRSPYIAASCSSEIKFSMTDTASMMIDSSSSASPALHGVEASTTYATPHIPGSSNICKVKLAVARDEAFCFFYKDNLRLLEEIGAEICYFSPLYDRKLPDGTQGLLLPGGYPELYAQMLSENLSMRESIASAIRNGLPCLAECGGFLYLHRELEDMEGHFFPMVGVIEAKAFRTERLGRFGYITLKAQTDSAFFKFGEEIRAHEFHYYESEDCGSDFLAVKPSGSRSWNCIHAEENLLAGFPHLFYEANQKPIERFLLACSKIR